jgi:hypothetical protein
MKDQLENRKVKFQLHKVKAHDGEMTETCRVCQKFKRQIEKSQNANNP